MNTSTRQNVITWTTAKLVYAICQWGMLVVLARLTNPAGVGMFTLALAITAPFITFASMNMRALQSTDVSKEHSFGKYLAVRLTAQTLALGIICLIALKYSGSSTLIILLVGLAKAFESLSDLAQGYFHQQFRSSFAARSLIIRGLASVLMLGLGVHCGGLVAGVAAMTAVWAIAALKDLRTIGSLEFPNGSPVAAGFIRPHFDWSSGRNILKLGLPLGFVATLSSFRVNLPRYFVDTHLGAEALGHFAALSYFLVAANIVVVSFAQVTAPRNAELLRSGQTAAARRFAQRSFLFCFLLGIGALAVSEIAGPTLLSATYGVEYALHAPELTWIMLAAGFSFMQTIGASTAIAARQLKIQPVIGIIGTAITGVSAAVLTPQQGLHGAALSLVLGYAFEGCFYLLLCLGPQSILSRRPQLQEDQS